MPSGRLVSTIWKFTQVLTVYTVSRIVLNMENPSFSLLRPSQYLIHHIIFSDAKKKIENAFFEKFFFSRYLIYLKAYSLRLCKEL